jgi:O-antigen/teichoic acid export membrane protein
MRRIAIEADNENIESAFAYIKAAFKVIAFSLTILIFLYSLFWPLISSSLNLISPNNVLFLFFLCIGVRGIEDHLTFVLKGLHRVKLSIALLNSPRQILSVLFLFLIWLTNSEFTLRGALLLYVCASLPASAIGLALLIKLWPSRLSKIASIKTYPLVIDSLPYFGMSLLSILMASVPLWMVSGLVGKTEAGLYGASIQLTFLISFFLGINNQITPHALASLFAANEKDRLEKILRTTAGWGVMLALPAVFILTLCGAFTLGLVYGPAYREAHITLIFLTLGQFVNATAGSPGLMLQMSGKQTLLLLSTSFWVIFNIGTGIFLVRDWGMNGIAAAHCFALIGHNLTMVYVVHNQFGVKTYPDFHYFRIASFFGNKR